ncbi:hypothetical protein HAX54_046588, partial [Datura stramonium]|nr:hypothetical protein [Datura stramonium]
FSSTKRCINTRERQKAQNKKREQANNRLVAGGNPQNASSTQAETSTPRKKSVNCDPPEAHRWQPLNRQCFVVHTTMNWAIRRSPMLKLAKRQYSPAVTGLERVE